MDSPIVGEVQDVGAGLPDRAVPIPTTLTSAAAGPPSARAARLLVVDDEVELLDALCEALRDAGFEVAGFSDPAAALAAVAGGGFDLLLSDQMMPGLSGVELLRRARAADPGLVGVIMTGHGSPQAAAEAAQAGAFDLVRKPFRMRQVLPTLGRALGARVVPVGDGTEGRRRETPTADNGSTRPRE